MRNLDIEKIGTDIIVAYEKKQGREIIKPKFKGCGWDLCTGDGNEIRFIEVKATKSKRVTGRWLEKAGHNQLQTNPHFYVYTVTDIQENDNSGILNIYTKADIEITEEIKYMLKFKNSGPERLKA